MTMTNRKALALALSVDAGCELGDATDFVARQRFGPADQAVLAEPVPPGAYDERRRMLLGRFPDLFAEFRDTPTRPFGSREPQPRRTP
jgi:hypothetical protein